MLCCESAVMYILAYSCQRTDSISKISQHSQFPNLWTIVRLRALDFILYEEQSTLCEQDNMVPSYDNLAKIPATNHYLRI